MVTGSAPAGRHPREASLTQLAGSVPDPELPVITLAELGVLRRVAEPEPGHVRVELTPTYTGCPAIEAMAADIERVLREEGGAERVEVRTVLSPPWSSDDISEEGRRKLAEHGVAPPRAGARRAGPVLVGLSPTRHTHPAQAPAPEPVRCPNCGSAATELLSRFSSTACKALRRCTDCREPFDHFKEV
ncbi:phenylacetate-CoA oxygenase subunit PaaJ [Streptomyces oryzae]|uniref:Phenylacetate-CoA oxygenase subunit PaaJ n=1 Tax=Streptomyces oryzae TaxID=1434886 RepID=A0ABS3XBM8_9ACTN|nr:1,2-phenylacetyl-CoA epoxidase subunit PaaD [Streptomyces oryzae]MBO8192785.1 phenylacetate-CoA oxygenase subunit PaaJ [Streptomyces oryzae]